MAFTMQAQKKDIVISREQGAITFMVDENLPKLNVKHKAVMDGKALATALARNQKLIHPGEGLVASSFMDDRMSSAGDDVLFTTIVQCFAEHRPLVLSPDMVWLVIAQGFSYYVNEHAEQLRDKFVSHEGRKTLSVVTSEDLIEGHPDWDYIMESFLQQIGEHTKGDIAKTITADFTTTGPTERIASEITLMDAMKEYFEYIVLYISCGIPDITLLGTPEDWQKVHDKAMCLKQYGLGWWTKDLDPILKEFVRASKGKPKQSFWQDMVVKMTVSQLRGASRGCQVGKPTILDGWFLKLFPYDKDGKRTPATVAHDSHMLSEMVCVPFRYVKTDGMGNVLSDTDMRLYAGLTGVKEDTVTLALTPQIGWMVRMAEEPQVVTDDIRRHLKTADGLDLRINVVPKALRGIPEIDRLTLRFNGRVILPSWMDTMKISQFKVYGKVTEEEAKALRQRFPQIKLPDEVHSAQKEKRSQSQTVRNEESVAKAYVPEMILDSVVYNYYDRFYSYIFEYDSLFRVRNVNGRNSFYVYDYSYREDGKVQRCVQSERGKPMRETRWEYDELGRVTLERDSFLCDDFSRYELLDCKEYAYDEQGRMARKDVHAVRRDGQSASHYRYVYEYGRGDKPKTVTKYEYTLADPWAYGDRIPSNIQLEVVGRGQYDKRGNLVRYEDLLRDFTTLYEYDADSRLRKEMRYRKGVPDPLDTQAYHYDDRGNLIAIDRYIDDLRSSTHIAYDTNYTIEQVAGMRDGFFRFMLPTGMPRSDFFTPQLKYPPLGSMKYHNDERDLRMEGVTYFYSENW